MNSNHHSELRQHLDANENLLWSGKPKTGIVFRAADIFMIPFSIVWCSFAIFWVAMASQASVLFALFGVPFVIVGLIFVFGRFIIDAKKRQNTVYGLTDNRIIIKSGVFSQTITSLNIKTLSNIELSEKGDGSGTVSLGPKNPFNFQGNGMSWNSRTKPGPQLEMIDNARKVYQLIVEVQNRRD